MLVKDLFEYNAWYGPDDPWHTQGGDDQWSNGKDEWHGEEGGGMVEDVNTANMVATEGTELSDVINARQLISAALRNPQNEKHKYFEFLKHLRTKHGADYSTDIHQRASKLSNQHKV